MANRTPNRPRTKTGTFVSEIKGHDTTLSRQSLARIFREIGQEVFDPETGLTRIQAVIRSLYADAIAGKVAAADIILERGWGKVPTPIKLDLRAEIYGILQEAGLSPAEASADPLLKEIIEGIVLESEVIQVGQLSTSR